ncbi:unknown [Clostridium sp. CAG:710]|nr:unknown [Clostridium sp. CAG:710]
MYLEIHSGNDNMLKELKIELTNKCSRIIKEAKLMGAETIVFTGGETLMYDRLPGLVELTSKLGMKSTIYIFAYRTDETLNKYKQLIDLGLNKIVYSLAD